MPKLLKIAKRPIGEGRPVYIIAEIGLNHNGDIDIAKQLIDTALIAKCDAVKFQKRNPDKCVPPEQKNLVRETPWGIMTYLEYRHKVEFGEAEYCEIDRYCKKKKIPWFASCWDEESIDFMEQFNPPCYKLPSAVLTNSDILIKAKQTGRPLILSTGMSTMKEIRAAVKLLGTKNLFLAHTTSTYPCSVEELNLRMIQTLEGEFDCPIGYSGHEVGLQTTYAAVVLGASFVERHITLNRSMWGSDQAASVEVSGVIRLVRDIRVIEAALGDGKKKVYDSEKPIIKKLRRSSGV